MARKSSSRCATTARASTCAMPTVCSACSSACTRMPTSPAAASGCPSSSGWCSAMVVGCGRAGGPARGRVFASRCRTGRGNPRPPPAPEPGAGQEHARRTRLTERQAAVARGARPAPGPAPRVGPPLAARTGRARWAAQAQRPACGAWAAAIAPTGGGSFTRMTVHGASRATRRGTVSMKRCNWSPWVAAPRMIMLTWLLWA